MEAKCIFFNFYEPEIIRREINEDLEHFFNSKIKNLMFATSSKVYAYMNQVVSVRIILAKFYKIPLEDIDDKDEEIEYKAMLKQDVLKMVEEESDSEEEEEAVPVGTNNNLKTVNLTADTKGYTGQKGTIELSNIKVENKGKEVPLEEQPKNVMIKI